MSLKTNTGSAWGVVAGRGTDGTDGADGANGQITSTGPVTINNIWSGSQVQYDALGVYDPNTLYFTPEA